MKNTKWIKNKFGDYEWRYKLHDLLIVKIHKKGNKWELPRAWFGLTKKYNWKTKESLPEAKAACEKWLKDFIKSVQ